MQFLLNNERVDEALELSEMVATRTVSSNEAPEDLESVVNFVRSRAAFISLKRMELRRAQELFIRGRVDPREIISLFPRMLPASSNFTRTVPALHDIADINQVLHKLFFSASHLLVFVRNFRILCFISQGNLQKCNVEIVIEKANIA